MSASSRRKARIRAKAAILCLASLLGIGALGTATYAWFTVNRFAKTAYQNIVASDDGLVKAVHYYGIQSVSGDTYTFSTENETSMQLKRYDREFGDGVYQVLIQVDFEDNAGAFALKAEAKEDLLGGQNSWAGVDWTKTPLPLSTIVSFCYFGASATRDDAAKTIRVSKTSSNTDVGFVTMDGDLPRYTQNLDLETKGQTGLASIYLMVDYNEAAITSIYSYNIGNSVFDGDYGSSSSGVSFGCDFILRVNAR